jgi:hypothetical protein
MNIIFTFLLLEIQTTAKVFTRFLLVTISVWILVMQNEHTLTFTSNYFQINFLLDSDGFPLFHMVLMFPPSNWKKWGHRKKAHGMTPFTPPPKILCFPFNHISLHFPPVVQPLF